MNDNKMENIKAIEIPVKDFLIKEKNILGLPVCRKINKRIALKILNSEKKEIKKNIVVFNNTKVIVTGEFLLAEKYLQNPKATISVKNMIFDKNRYSYSENPWISYLFYWNRARIISIAKKLLHRK